MEKKRTLVFIAICLLAFVNYSYGFKVGSRGLSDLDMTQDDSDMDAGNKIDQKNKNNIDLKRNKILKSFTNKEYLFEDLEDSGPKEIASITVHNQVAPTNELQIGDLKADSENKVKKPKARFQEKLHRMQRTNAHDDLFRDSFDKLPYEQLLKLNKINDINQKEKNVKSQKDYEFFSHKLNSEDNMNVHEIKQDYDLLAKEKEYPYGLDYLDDFDMEDLYKQLLAKSKSLNFPDQSGESEINDEPIYRNPVIHYKEAFISGDFFNNRPKSADDAETNLNFKKISEQPYVNYVKYDKYNYDDPLSTRKLNAVNNQKDYLLISIIAGCTLSALLAAIAGGVCFYTINRSKQAGFDSKNGLFATTGLSKSGSIKSNTSSSSGDRRLAQSAQMFHYQHQKQQMLAMEIANKGDKPDLAESSEGENDDADFTVYECPGLAPTGEMEVKNPLFKEDFASSTNLNASSNSLVSQPPAYSTINVPSDVTKPEPEKSNLVQINEKQSKVAPVEKTEEK